MRRIGAMAVAGAVAAILAGAARAEPAPVIGYVTKSATNQGWVLINRGARDAAADGGATLIVAGPGAQGALASQINAVQHVLSEGAKAIAIAPIDSAGIGPIVDRVGAGGLPVIAIDTAIVGAPVRSYVGTDNIAAARAQAEWVAQAIGDGDKVILVNGSLSQSTGRDRRQGFLDRLKELKPQATVLEVQTDWGAAEAEAGVTQTLRANPDVTAIANAWDEGTLGAIAAARAAGFPKGKLHVIGFDGAPNALAFLKDGWIQADIAQMLYREGYDGIKTAIAAAKGEQVQPRIDTGYQLVTADNLETFITQNRLSDFMR